MLVIHNIGIACLEFEASTYQEVVQAILEELKDIEEEYPGWSDSVEDPIAEVAAVFTVNGIPAFDISEIKRAVMDVCSVTII